MFYIFIWLNLSHTLSRAWPQSVPDGIHGIPHLWRKESWSEFVLAQTVGCCLFGHLPIPTHKSSLPDHTIATNEEGEAFICVYSASWTQPASQTHPITHSQQKFDKHTWYSYNTGCKNMNASVYFLHGWFFKKPLEKKLVIETLSQQYSKYKLHEGHILYGSNNRAG